MKVPSCKTLLCAFSPPSSYALSSPHKRHLAPQSAPHQSSIDDRQHIALTRLPGYVCYRPDFNGSFSSNTEATPPKQSCMCQTGLPSFCARRPSVTQILVKIVQSQLRIDDKLDHFILSYPILSSHRMIFFYPSSR